MRNNLIVALALLVVLVSVAVYAEDDKDKAKEQPANTYFGVDANDKEAVAKKQKELNDEKFTQIFGDEHNIEHFDFTPDFGKHPIVEAHEKFSNFMKKFLNGVFNGRKNQETQNSTPEPKKSE